MLTDEEKKHNRDERQKKVKKQQRLAKRIAILLIIIMPLTLIFGRFLWGPIGVNILYSAGERYATIIKLSNKGLIWRTWECEAVLSTKAGFSATYVWSFSIDDNDSNRDHLVESSRHAFETGRPVKIRYVQMAGSVPWRSKTAYFIKEIRFSD